MAIERQDEGGDDYQYLLRVVTKTKAGTYLLKATNPDYADLPASDDLRTLARLKAILDPLDLQRGRSSKVSYPSHTGSNPMSVVFSV